MNSFVLGVLLLASQIASASELGEAIEKSVSARFSSEVVLTANDVQLTDADIRAFLEAIPQRDRARFLQGAQRFAKSMQGMVDYEQLARLGVETGVLDDPVVSAGLYAKIMREVARRHVDQVVEERALEDYSQQARELYLTDPEQFKSEPTYSFTHLLVATKDRSRSEALRRMVDILDELESGKPFDVLVQEYSDDVSSVPDGGQIESVNLETLDRNVARAIRNLEETGKISEPIRSRYGWHLVRLDDIHETDPPSWEQAKEQAKQLAEQQHKERIRSNYVEEMTDATDVKIAPDLVKRYQREYGARPE